MEKLDLTYNAKQSFYFIYHCPLEIVYKTFADTNVIKVPSLEIVSMKRPNPLDDAGNEVCIKFLIKERTYVYSFRIENVVDQPHFKSFTHRSISNPCDCSDFILNYSFLWNSTDKTTIFKFSGGSEDNEHINFVLNYFLDNKDIICLNLENTIINSIKNREENESISLNLNVDSVWDFISDLKNQNYFYLNQNKTKINVVDENQIEIIDLNNNVKSLFKATRTENKKEKIMELNLFESNVSIPHQKVILKLLKLNENKTFLIFKHIILEYIPYDILMSYSSTKKKILKNLKSVLEGKKFIENDSFESAI